jgi:glycosyltransferase involved in cell wall biosynthesis
MPPEAPVVAFHAPLKAPDHPTPSGDRTIARLMLAALARAGFAPVLASRLRTLDRTGDAAVQARLRAEADAEVRRLCAGPRPTLWFTYHCHYKAPDLIGPVVARAFGVPYVIAEPSFAAHRLEGAWAGFATATAEALKAADRLLWTPPRDRPGLAALCGEARLVHLPAFLDPGGEPARRPPGDGPLRLLVVAMMRDGDKAASYAALAAALARVRLPFTLDVVGDGPARAEVTAWLQPFAPRLNGAIDDAARLRAAMEAADLLVWPGVGEGVGMVYLEAQAAALPCLAEDRPAQASILYPGLPRTAPGDPAALAAAIDAAAADRAALAVLGRAARAHVLAHHSLDAAAATLRTTLEPLIR